MNLYELLRLMVKSSADMPNKDQAFSLINDLETSNAFGTSGLIQGDGKAHDHVPQEELYIDGIRHILRCSLCRKDIGQAFFPPTQHPGTAWRR